MVCEGRPSTPCALEAVAKAWMPAFAGMTVVRRRARYFHAYDAEAHHDGGAPWVHRLSAQILRCQSAGMKCCRDQNTGRSSFAQRLKVGLVPHASGANDYPALCAGNDRGHPVNVRAGRAADARQRHHDHSFRP